MENKLNTYTVNNFKKSENPEDGTFAYVISRDDSTVYLDKEFCSAPVTGRDSRMGVKTRQT